MLIHPPTFSVLDENECRDVLARQQVGRLAYTTDNQVDIRPVHYVLRDDWIFGRTASDSGKLSTLDRFWRVAFEVDEIDGLFDWRSVVVRGGFYILSSMGTPTEARRWSAAVDALRTLVPSTLTEDDPVPFRDAIFGIAVQEMNGRRASTAGPD